MNKGQFEFNITSVLRLVIILIILGASLYVILPFLGALTWAGIIAISMWPTYKRVTERLGGRHKLASVSIVIVLALLIAVPLTAMAFSVIDALPTLNNLASNFHISELPPLPQWLTDLPIVGKQIAHIWTGLHTNLSGYLEQVRPAINSLVLWILGGGASVGYGLLEMIFAIIISGVFLIKGDAMWDQFENITHRIGGHASHDYPDIIARTIRGVSIGVVGTALIQTILCAIGLYIAGIPGVLILGFLCFVLSVAQMPTLLIWLPAALWLLHINETGYGIFLLIWGFVLVNSIDNILRPMLISHEAKMPLSIIFIGVIGGLMAWGMIGLFIGPTLLSVTLTMFNFWLTHKKNRIA